METTAILAKLFSAYPNAQPISEGTWAVYVERLGHLPPEVLLRAVDQCIDEHESFLPTVSTVLKASKGLLGATDDEVRTARPLLPGPIETAKALAQVPDLFAKELYRESDAERRARLKRTDKWDHRYRT